MTEFWLRWSRDGKQWKSIATGIVKPKIRIPGDQMPQGKGLLQIVAHDGFFSGYAEPVRIRFPSGRRGGVILHPVDGHTYVAGQSVETLGLRG